MRRQISMRVRAVGLRKTQPPAQWQPHLVCRPLPLGAHFLLGWLLAFLLLPAALTAFILISPLTVGLTGVTIICALTLLVLTLTWRSSDIDDERRSIGVVGHMNCNT
jgi:hypothetical protein